MTVVWNYLSRTLHLNLFMVRWMRKLNLSSTGNIHILVLQIAFDGKMVSNFLLAVGPKVTGGNV